MTTYRIRAEAESFLELKRGCAETLLENREERFNGGSLLQQLRQTRKEMLCLSNSYLSGLVKDFCSQLVRFSWNFANSSETTKQSPGRQGEVLTMTTCSPVQRSMLCMLRVCTGSQLKEGRVAIVLVARVSAISASTPMGSSTCHHGVHHMTASLVIKDAVIRMK